MADQEFEYDVFLSYSSKDKQIVHALAERLRNDGVRVWLDAWVIQPGDSISMKIARGVEKSRVLVMCMSPDYFESEWGKLEHHSMLFRDPTNTKRRFLPLLIKDCRPPDIIAQFAYIDWRRRNDTKYNKLLAGCRMAVMEASLVVSQTNQFRMSILCHIAPIWAVAVTPDGRTVISGSKDGVLNVSDLATGQCLTTLNGHEYNVVGLAVTPDGKQVISSSWDQKLKVWNLETAQCVATLNGASVNNWGVAISGDGRTAIAAFSDNALGVWDLKTKELSNQLEGHIGTIRGVAISHDGRLAVSGSLDSTLKVWDLVKGQCLHSLEGHTGNTDAVAIAPDTKTIVSGSSDNLLKVWDAKTGECRATFEGHTRRVARVAITPDNKRVISASNDHTVKVWDLATGICVVTFERDAAEIDALAISPDGKVAISGSTDNTLCVWELPESDMVVQDDATQYTNAKVVLVGESGAGKTGLALRLAEDRWQETESTHGMNVWPLQLPSLDSGGMEREVWLWDFAGQPDYRLIHQLYMDETALALLVIDPQRDNPLEPLEHWEKALQAAVRHDPARLLIAARCDRGGFTISRKKIDQHCTAQGYLTHLNTSAKTAEGCDDLKTLIADHIPWDRLSWTATSRLFKTLKDAILAVKEEGMALVRISELRQRLQLELQDESIEETALRTVVGLLESQGIVKTVDFGDFVLLQPAQINNYASAVVRSARENSDEIGAVPERDVLEAQIDFKDMDRLGEADEKILLRAMLQTFLDRSLCARVETDKGTQLVFPSYFKQDRPEAPEKPPVIVNYSFSGPLDAIYSTLVVRLHYTETFEMDELWRYAADFKTQSKQRVGLLMTKKRGGEADIQVYFDADVPIDTKVAFIKYIHQHLLTNSDSPESVTRVRSYVCPHCHEPLENQRAIEVRLQRGLNDIACGFCEGRVPLLDLIEEKFASDEFSRRVQTLDQQAGINLDQETRGLAIVGHAMAIAEESGQVFTTAWSNSKWGINAEIEFKDTGGKRVFLQLKSSDIYRFQRRPDGQEIFAIRHPQQVEHWLGLDGPVMLVIRDADGVIRWMNITEYIQQKGPGTKQIVFEGEAFTAANVALMRTRVLESEVTVSNPKALKIWRERLEHFQIEEAKTGDPNTLFTIQQQIKECEQKIAELSHSKN